MLSEGALHEGTVLEDTGSQVKSEMIRQIRRLGPTTPQEWEQATFLSFAGASHAAVDWEIEDNQAGAYTWVKSFDQLIEELIDDGYVKVVEKDGSRHFVARHDREDSF